MGSISKPHQAELDRLAAKAQEVWVWNIGSDVSPSLIDGEDLAIAYEAIREAIRYDLDGIAKRSGLPGYSESYVRGSLFPAIWKTISALGVMLDYDDEGELVPATAKHLRGRLLKPDQEAQQLYKKWDKSNTVQRTEKRITKQRTQWIWNQQTYETMTSLSRSWLINGPGGGNEKETLARYAVAITWFTGRRPWSETCLNVDFKPANGPDWAEGWLVATGFAKKTKAVVEGRADAQRITLPLFGITAAEFLQGFEAFRSLLAQQPWFQPGNPKGHEYTKAALYHWTKAELQGPVARAFDPTIEAGYPVELTMKSFRALYPSYGCERRREWSLANGKETMNLPGFAKRFIGHFGSDSEADTGEYLRFTYVGDMSIAPYAPDGVSDEHLVQ